MHSSDDIIAFSFQEEIRMVPIDSLVYMEASGNYSQVQLENGESLIVSRTLKELEEKLPGDQFIRIHQGYLVNKYYVEKFFKQENTLLLLTGTRLPVAVRRRKELMDHFRVL